MDDGDMGALIRDNQYPGVHGDPITTGAGATAPGSAACLIDEPHLAPVVSASDRTIDPSRQLWIANKATGITFTLPLINSFHGYAPVTIKNIGAGALSVPLTGGN